MGIDRVPLRPALRAEDGTTRQHLLPMVLGTNPPPPRCCVTLGERAKE